MVCNLKSKRPAFTALACLLLMFTAPAAGPAPSPGVEAAAGAESGTHFILLIDDSGDMRRRHRDVLAGVLPEFLLTGSVEGRATEPALPNFRPGLDRISLVYFTILKTTGGGCREGQRGMSVSPDEIFTFEGGEGVGSRGELSDFLGESLRKPCRNRGTDGKGPGQYSPIATSQMLVLPYLQRQLKDDRLYSKTILIVANNEIFNTAEDSPAYELSHFDAVTGITDIEDARQVSYQVSRLFSFNTFSGWDIRVRPDLFLVVSEVRPRPEPDLAVSLPRSIKVDRVAVSPDGLRVVPEAKGAGDLRILTGGEDAPYRFLPLFMEMRFRDAGGAAWRVGRTTLEGTASVDLKECGPPKCVADGDSFTVSLLDPAGDDLTLSPTDPLLDAGALDVNVWMRYQTGLYDHMLVNSSGRHVEIVPTRADTLPGYLFLPDVTLDNRELARQYARDDDGVTTQTEARSHILVRHSLYTLCLIFITFAAVALAVAYLVRTRYHRPFRPRLKWEPASEVVVDFNRPAASRVLVGALRVVNEGGLPWLGRVLKNEEQPTRRARLQLSYNFFKGSGLELAEERPLGFVRAGASADGRYYLSLDAEEAVSDGTHVYIFLAADSIRDYLHPAPAAQGKDFKIDLSVQMGWRVREQNGGNSLVGRLKPLLVVDDQGELKEPIQCSLTVRPEEERKPRVTFERREGRLEFRKGEDVLVGKFVFHSRAGHTFARPFKGCTYAVRVLKDNVPMNGQPMRLERPDVEVAPGRRVEVPVYLFCDGETVVNPDPVSDTYTFTLVGDFAADSEPGSHSATLFRDPGRPEIELSLLFPKPEREIFWSKAGGVRQRLVLPGGAAGAELPVESSTVVLDAPPVKFRSGGPGTRNLLTLRIGNSAAVGRGEVAARVRTVVWCPQVETDIVMAAGSVHDDMLGVYAHGESRLLQEVRVGAGGDPQALDVRIDHSLIEKIQSAVIPPEKFEARVILDITVTDDEGRAVKRPALNFVIPLGLEQRPGRNWLCIDFGTSAIAAALGTASGVRPIPLQDLKPRGGQSLAEYDPFNSERGDPYLLPSLVICDADRRAKTDLISRPGFPAYYSPELSFTPGEPDFVGLPATETQIRLHPERIVYSLKSWLAKAPGSIPMKSGIAYKENGRLVPRQSLPLEKMVESGFAALAEGYLLVTPEYHADRIVLCHPNTFTQRHVKLLRDIAHSALGKAKPHGFGIPLQERIRLISESDAVAYYYCMEQMSNRPRGGSELILVYDFGAGTLDLSLIRVTWEKEQFATPVGWDVLGRIGVPVAGNYLDELLARMVDDLLNDPRLPGREFIKYQYPIVRKERHNPQATHEYREAVLKLWRAIRDAKHAWDGTSRLKIKVGELRSFDRIIRPKEEEGQGTKRSIDWLNALPSSPDGEAALWSDDNHIYLSVAAERVHKDTRVSAFVEFVTETVIDELCGGADVPVGEVEAVVVSGRGALWPGLRDSVLKRFHTDAARPNLMGDGAMKNAVVRGAIGRQVNVRLSRNGDESRWKPKLGVLLNDDRDLFVEDDWERQPINLSRSETFRIVQVNLKNPNPREDLKPGSLRRHFYVDLVNRKFERDELWDETRELHIHKAEDEKNGELTLYIEDRQSNHQEPIITHASAGETVTDLPWPIGPAYILEPDGAHAGGPERPSGEEG